MAVIGFSRVFLERSTARAFETLALYTKAAWLNMRDARAALYDRNYEQERANALGEIVTVHEGHLHTAMADFAVQLEASRSEARRAAEAGAEKTEHQNSQLRRTQRAMLNVIDDLREARRALESQVLSRTRELGIANKQLETRNRELEEFVYIASHDRQEPLRTLGGYLQMIQRRYGSKLGVEADEFIGFAIAGAQRIQLLLEGLLLYSRVATAETPFEFVRLEEPLTIALRKLGLRIEESHAEIHFGELPQVRDQGIGFEPKLIASALAAPASLTTSSSPSSSITWGPLRDRLAVLIQPVVPPSSASTCPVTKPESALDAKKT